MTGDQEELVVVVDRLPANVDGASVIAVMQDATTLYGWQWHEKQAQASSRSPISREGRPIFSVVDEGLSELTPIVRRLWPQARVRVRVVDR